MSKTSTANDWVNPLPGVPDIESPFFDDIFARKTGEPGWYEVACSLRENGYAVIDFPDPEIDAVINAARLELSPRFDLGAWRKNDWQKGRGLRVQDAWQFSKPVRRLAGNTTVMRLLEYLYGRPAFPFQTLNFPVGTQQHFHSDSVHFSSMPERFMCGVWLAMEDTDASNGPLVYYPGSHKLPVYSNEHIGHFSSNPSHTRQDHFEPAWRELVRVHGLQRTQFHARKGQALIWMANLLHGGESQADPKRTRWSQVTHYYFQDCIYYTPLHSDVPYGRVYLRDMVDLTTGEAVPNRYMGRELPADLAAILRERAHTYDGPERLPEGFSGAAYLAANPDVKAAGVDPARHYVEFGRAEGRPLR